MMVNLRKPRDLTNLACRAARSCQFCALQIAGDCRLHRHKRAHLACRIHVLAAAHRRLLNTAEYMLNTADSPTLNSGLAWQHRRWLGTELLLCELHIAALQKQKPGRPTLGGSHTSRPVPV